MLSRFSSSSTSRKCFDRSGDPVRRPDQDDIEAAAAGIAHQLDRGRAGAPWRRRSGRYTRATISIAALGGHLAQVVAAGSRDADRRSRPADRGRRVSLAPPFRLRRRVLRDIASGCTPASTSVMFWPWAAVSRLEAVVQLDGYVQIHSLHLLWFGLLDCPHLLPSEVRISGYEYGRPGKAPAAVATFPRPAGRSSTRPAMALPLDVEAGGHGLELLPGSGNRFPPRLPPTRKPSFRPAGPPPRSKGPLLAGRADQVAEELAPDLAVRRRGGKSGREALETNYSYTHYS